MWIAGDIPNVIHFNRASKVFPFAVRRPFGIQGILNHCMFEQLSSSFIAVVFELKILITWRKWINENRKNSALITYLNCKSYSKKLIILRTVWCVWWLSLFRNVLKCIDIPLLSMSSKLKKMILINNAILFCWYYKYWIIHFTFGVS